RRRHTRWPRDWSSDVCSSDLGTVVRLGDIADVVLGAETYDQEVRFNGQTAVFIGIFTLPTANTLDVMKAVRAALPEIQAQLPAEIGRASCRERGDREERPRRV